MIAADSRARDFEPNRMATEDDLSYRAHNRANQMLSWLDMWDKGQKMMAIGMTRQFLGESMAIEISPDPAKKSE